MRLLLSNNKQVENSVNKDGMETWGNQQSVAQTGSLPVPAAELRLTVFRVAPSSASPFASSVLSSDVAQASSPWGQEWP
jgi:hypothetical protein